MFDLYSYPLLMVFVVGLAVVLAVSEIGWQLGVRAEGRGSSNLTTLESAMLGLLALMIAFTFSMALSRFEARRDAVMKEANSIGTTALRARLLPEPHRTETRGYRRSSSYRPVSCCCQGTTCHRSLSSSSRRPNR